MLHLMGAPSMQEHTGKFLDWGYKNSSFEMREPVDLERYPGNGKTDKLQLSPTMADPALLKKFHSETALVTADLRSKYAP